MIYLFRTLPLRRKILLPFFLVLALLGLTATAGSIFVIVTAFSRSADHRLASLQDVLYREIKDRENLLLTYASILEHTSSLAGDISAREAESGTRSGVFKALENAQVSVNIFPAPLSQENSPASLRSLITQAVRSGHPRFRFSSEGTSAPSLIVAVPTGEKGGTPAIMVIRTPITPSFLRRLTAGFDADTALLSLDGNILAISNHSFTFPRLSPEELEGILVGKRLFKESGFLGNRKYLFQAVPLGTTDMVITAVEISTGDLRSLLTTLLVRSGVSFLAALALGAYLYSRLINQIMAPTRDLLEGTAAVSEGNLDYRIEKIPEDEMGQLARSFNSMTVQLRNLYRENMERERELTVAQEELKYKEALERKTQEVEQTNLELKAHLRELSAVFQLNQAMISTLDIGQLFDRIMDVLQDVIGCEGMALLLYHAGMEELEIRKTAGLDPELLQKTAVRLDSSMAGRAARSQELVYVPNVRMENQEMSSRAEAYPDGSLIWAPMVVQKRLAGVLTLHKSTPHGFSPPELKLVQAVANQAAIAVENARLYERTRNLSNTDELTGLANRRYFHEILKREIAQAQRYGSTFSLIMVDIDHFKLFNDTYGHLVGDLALKTVAQILLQNTRGIDLVARFGGEEFVLLLPKTDQRGAVAAAEKLRQCVADTVFTPPSAGIEGRLTVSVGLAEFPKDGKEMYELLDRADRALYRAKERGRNRAVLWSEANIPSHPAGVSAPL